jgi:hypothetical protein
LSNPVNATLGGQNSYTLTIEDNDEGASESNVEIFLPTIRVP